MFKLMMLFLIYILVEDLPKMAQAGEIEDLIQLPIQKCKSELNPKADDTKILHDLTLMPKNEDQSCLLDCYFNKVNLIKDGKIDHGLFMKLANLAFGGNLHGKETQVEQGFLKCQQEVEKKSKEKCGVGFALRSCWIEMNKS